MKDKLKEAFSELEHSFVGLQGAFRDYSSGTGASLEEDFVRKALLTRAKAVFADAEWFARVLREAA